MLVGAGSEVSAPTSLTLEPKARGELTLEWRPLHAGEGAGQAVPREAVWGGADGAASPPDQLRSAPERQGSAIRPHAHAARCSGLGSNQLTGSIPLSLGQLTGLTLL